MAQEAAPTVSIVATVRNERSTICAFVESLLAQSHRADEIIIVDGASTDGTKEILEAYSRSHRLIVISQSCNIAQGRNIGIRCAAGELIAVTDAGCKVDANWLRELIRCFAANPGTDVVAGNFTFEALTKFERAVVLATFQPDRNQTDAARYFPSSRSVSFRKSAWERAGGYPEWLYAAEDTLFNIRLRQVGCRFEFCREAYVTWRPRENWRALARQRINFAQGNSRVGIGTDGYLKNLRIHGAMCAFLLGTFITPWGLAVAGTVFAYHVKQHLWPQASKVTTGMGWEMLFRVLTVMEFVRVVSLWGFLKGRWERRRDPRFVESLVRYMNVTAVDELRWV